LNEIAVRALVERVASAHPAPGLLVYVDTPSFVFSDAIGQADPLGTPLTADASVRIASITKSFVAASVFRLIEQRQLGLDERIGTLVGSSLNAVLGDERGRKVTVHHLLTHTSGLPDYATDTEFSQIVRSDPSHHWSREEQVQLALDNCVDVGSPGERFHYSDTGYVILGEIVERATGADLAASLRALLRFRELGLNSIYLESIEDSPIDARERAYQYSAGIELHDADPSFDLWGGGGLVSTVRDIAAFYRALFEGRVFDKPETLTLMTSPVAHEEGAAMCSGLTCRPYAGNPVYGHGGYWGLYGGYAPSLRLALAICVLERDASQAIVSELVTGLIALAHE
jgi:D-alanyl-D-alanine carboxypeptidase